MEVANRVGNDIQTVVFKLEHLGKERRRKAFRISREEGRKEKPAFWWRGQAWRGTEGRHRVRDDVQTIVFQA